MGDELSIIETSDGSNSISSKKYNASYHSLHGAIEESMHIFISAGIYYKFRQGLKKLKIFEMGFGSGLNAFLSVVAAQKHEIEIEYHSIELHPLKAEIYKSLNFHTFIPDAKYSQLMQLHECPWEETCAINDHFSIKKIHGDLHSVELNDHYDLIYYDAFAPSSQPQLWEEEIQRKLYGILKAKGALLTYCAQGKFKRTLKTIGYELDSLDGPGRKHEMTRAVKV